MRVKLIWGALAIVILVPIGLAASSPLLAWREPIYIIAGFAGVIAMALLLTQPLLIGGYLPDLAAIRYRQFHRWVGGILVAAIIIHVAGLWLTSPPDVIDALLFSSPTPFSAWGVVAMWAVFATALLAMLRKRLSLRLNAWRIAHMTLAITIATSSVMHAMLIEGTMETFSKTVLCAFVLIATIKVIMNLWLKIKPSAAK